MDEIIKHLDDLTYRILGKNVDIYLLRSQVGVLAGLVQIIAVKVKQLEDKR